MRARIHDKESLPMVPVRTGALLALLSPLCMAFSPAATHPFFPQNPAFGDQLHVLQPSDCQDPEAPSSPPILYRHVVDDGSISWTLFYEVDAAVCPGTPPPHGTVYAFPLPAEVGSRASDKLSIRLLDVGNSNALTVWRLPLPQRTALPPSVAGTWFAPTLTQQGLMLGYDAQSHLSVSFNTYGADGEPRWHSGIAPVPQDDAATVVPLRTIASGTFAGSAQPPAPVVPWGDIELEYVACGEMLVRWTPDAATNLAAGSATLAQLTGSFSDSCDLDAWAARRNSIVVVMEPEVIHSDGSD
jgi:hypothetical protein